MLIPVFSKPRRQVRFGKPKASSPPPPAPLVLTSATYEPDGPNLNLEFDRDVDISGIDPAAFTVHDGADGWLMLGATASMPASNWVQVQLYKVGDIESGPVTLDAADGNGIAGVGGGAWSGTEGMGLPFP